MEAPEPLTSLGRAVWRLYKAGIDTPNLDAGLLYCKVLGCTRTELMAHPGRQFSPSQEAHFEALISRREAREPLPHLLGEWEFMGHAYEVGPQALIPRPETEGLVEAVMERLDGGNATFQGASHLRGLTPRPPSLQGKGEHINAGGCDSGLPSPGGRGVGGEARVSLAVPGEGLSPQPPSLEMKGVPKHAAGCDSELPSPGGRGAEGEARVTQAVSAAGLTPQPPSLPGKGEPNDADGCDSGLPSPGGRGAGGEARVPQQILEVGTGAGCIAIELALRLPHSQVTSIDVSPEALELASRNVARFDVQDRVTLSQARFQDDVTGLGRFDAIVSNPPYIPSADVDHLAPELIRYEPRTALDGGADGLDVIRSLISESRLLLKPGGLLAMEIGHNQAEKVFSLLREAGWSDIEGVHDLAGILRVVLARD